MDQTAIVTKMSEPIRSVAVRAVRSPRAAHLVSAIVGVGVTALLLVPVPPGPPAWLPDWLPRWLADGWPSALFSQADKGVHAGLFFALAGVWFRSFDRLPGWPRPLATAVLAAALYGAALEGVQALTPERTSSPADAAANLCGALLLGLVVRRSSRRTERRLSHHGIRFAPPALAPDLLPDLRWLLARAFGPTPGPAARAGESPPVVPPNDAERAVDLARRLGIAARIATRTDRAVLATELGAAADVLQAERRTATAEGLRLEAAIRAIAGAAATAGISIAFLKYGALELSGVLAPGGRAASDIDVLAPAGREEELRDALVAVGFALSAGPGYEHQLAPQVHPRFGAVEVHRLILGVRLGGRVGGRRSATLDALVAAGLAVPCTALPGQVMLPVADVLAAHAAVHGLAQHGYEPLAYPALRTFADLLDLGWGGPLGHQSAARSALWLAEDLSGAELEALVELCVDLGAGRTQLKGERGSALLLRHALAGRLDPAYQSALKLSLFAARPSDRSALGRRVATLAAALWPTVAQLDAIYGRPSGRWNSSLRRLWRPFDLLRRGLRSAKRAGEVDRTGHRGERPNDEDGSLR